MSSEHRIADRPVEDLVLARMDRALDPDDEAALETHLGLCRECLAFAARQERLHAALRALGPARVDAADHERLWAGVASRRAAATARWPQLAGQLALAACVVLVAALAGFLLIQSRPAAAPPPLRELVATQTSDLRGSTATLSVLQGSAFARGDTRTGVGVEAQLSFAQSPTAGSAEIRFRAPGDTAYGILGAAPDLRGVTRAAFGGIVPRPASAQAVTYEVWIHVETDGSTSDTQPLTIQVIPTRDGERVEGR